MSEPKWNWSESRVWESDGTRNGAFKAALAELWEALARFETEQGYVVDETDDNDPMWTHERDGEGGGTVTLRAVVYPRWDGVWGQVRRAMVEDGLLAAEEKS